MQKLALALAMASLLAASAHAADAPSTTISEAQDASAVPSARTVPQARDAQAVPAAQAVPDAAVDEHLGTKHTGMGGAVKLGPGNAHAMHGGLNDDILLGMQAPAYLVPLTGRDAQLLPQATDLQTVGDPGGRAIVARGQDAFVLDGNGAHLATGAGGALAHHIGDVHEVVRPGKSVLHGKARFRHGTRRGRKSQA